MIVERFVDVPEENSRTAIRGACQCGGGGKLVRGDAWVGSNAQKCKRQELLISPRLVLQ